MRLLKFNDGGQLEFTEDLIDRIPAYAILSHTWGEDKDEVTFDDIRTGAGTNKTGYNKIVFCGEQAKMDGLKHFWVDTCCIDKANHTELSEAITSMFAWYRDADRCYVYLKDVSLRTKNNKKNRAWKSDFRKSRWFTRGWTLQELLAPKSVHFFSRENESLGTKTSLQQQIHEVTQIPLAALGGTPLCQFDPEERLQWASTRETKKVEDKAYCLLGIFGVSMSLRYGEKDAAFRRLKEKIDRRSGEKGFSLVNIDDH
jgi:hypothetical protein